MSDPPRLGTIFPSLAAFRQAQDAWWHSTGDARYSVWYDVWDGSGEYAIAGIIAYCRRCGKNLLEGRKEKKGDRDSPPPRPNIDKMCKCKRLAIANATD